MSTIRLWRAPLSTNVERVALALAHKDLSVESVVISYLESRYPSPPLFPADPAEMDVFIDWFNRVWKVAPNAIEVETDSDRIAAHAETMREHLAWFEALLSDRDHLLGDDVSAADCVAFPFLKFARGRDADGRPALNEETRDSASCRGPGPTLGFG